MNTGAIAIGVAAVAALLLASGASASDVPTPGGNVSRKKVMWDKLQSIAWLTPTQRYALMLIARREGGYDPGAHNGSATERAASAKMAANSPTIVQRAASCGVPLAALETGSWGTFQMLAPIFSGTAHEVFGSGFCPFADPTRQIHNLNLQIVLAIEHARDLQLNYKGFAEWPTVGALYLGWGQPSRMGADAPVKWKDKLDVYRGVAAAEKFPDGIVDAHLTTFPSNPAQIYAELQAMGPP